MKSADSLPAIIAAQETLIPVGDVPKMLPPRSTGKRIHISACYRWITRGIRGVKLEVVRIGGGMYTSREAVARFAVQLSQRGDAAPSVAVSQQRQRQLEQARTRLKDLLS